MNTLDDIVDYNRARVQKGATAEADLIRIQLESDRLKAQARLAAEQARRSLIALYREMGATAFPDSVVFTDRLDDLAEIRPPDLQTVLRDRPEMRAAREGVKQAEANFDLQRANAVPDPELMAGYKRFSGSGQFTGQNTLFFGFQVPLPIFDRNQGQIAAAQAKVLGAKHAVTDQEIAIRAEVARPHYRTMDQGGRRCSKFCPEWPGGRPCPTRLRRAHIDWVAPISCASWTPHGWISRLRCCSFKPLSTTTKAS